MNKLLLFFIFLLSPIIKADETCPEFYFREKVEVRVGFYKGCRGIIERRWLTQNDKGVIHTYYSVDLDCRQEVLTYDFGCDELKKVNK